MVISGKVANEWVFSVEYGLMAVSECKSNYL